jgi:hypothetical protein
VQRAAAAGAGLPVIQRWTDGTMSGDDPVFQANNGRAGSVEVHNLHGRPLGPAANSPSVEPVGWPQLRQEGYTKGAPGGEKPVGAPYRAVRMHLFNGRLGGPGNNVLNLAPGPGKLNSQMSAQAEDPAKLLVELGHQVWLRTTVRYQQNNSVNAADFASVVPNHITMEWGVENNPAFDGQWSSSINLPVNPLSGAQVAVYRNWAGTAGQLVQEMNGADVSDQMRAQVLGLVPNDQLKLALLNAFPALYRGAEGADQTRYILLYPTVADRVAFLRRMGLTTKDLFPQALQPLYRATAQAAAEELFRHWGLSDDVQREMVFKHGAELLQAIGMAGVELVERQGDKGHRLVKYYSESDQMILFDTLESRGTLGTMLLPVSSPRERNTLLDRWAEHRGHTTSDAKKAFIDTTGIAQAHKTEYGNWRDAQDASDTYRSGRPRRAAAAGAHR